MAWLTTQAILSHSLTICVARPSTGGMPPPRGAFAEQSHNLLEAFTICDDTC